jgi:D-aminoacyl-tRNA deacylase
LIALIQRVSQASLAIDGKVVARIGRGILALVAVRPADDDENARELLTRMVQYRLFGDAEKRMNLSLAQICGELLLVPQFTLAADTRKGLRPSFSAAAAPAHARRIFEHLCQAALHYDARVQTGVFGADMQVSLTNDGPVTFWLES